MTSQWVGGGVDGGTGHGLRDCKGVVGRVRSHPPVGEAVGRGHHPARVHKAPRAEVVPNVDGGQPGVRAGQRGRATDDARPQEAPLPVPPAAALALGWDRLRQGQQGVEGRGLISAEGFWGTGHQVTAESLLHTPGQRGSWPSPGPQVPSGSPASHPTTGSPSRRGSRVLATSAPVGTTYCWSLSLLSRVRRLVPSHKASWEPEWPGTAGRDSYPAQQPGPQPAPGRSDSPGNQGPECRLTSWSCPLPGLCAGAPAGPPTHMAHHPTAPPHPWGPCCVRGLCMLGGATQET